LDCAEQSGVCRSGSCQVVSCSPIAPCGSDEICAQGQCYPTACAAGACASGEACVSGTCTEATCVGVTCNGSTEVCARGVCYPKDCPDAPCGSTGLCVSDKCVARDCVEVKCPAGQMCLGGICQLCPGGSNETQCGDGLDNDCEGLIDCEDPDCQGQSCGADKVCAERSCQPASCSDGIKDGDETGPDCGGALCGGCAEGEPCAAKSDCQAELDCQDGTCQPECDSRNDPRNCGTCGHVCPVPEHAAATCARRACGRGPCQAGWFDLDGARTFGCETKCEGRVCTNPDGWTITLAAEPLPETGPVFQELASGSSFGNAVQTSAKHTNLGVLGEPFGGQIEQGSASHKNRGGLMSLKPR
ncbi:MAG: hypothetical protein HY901_01375, partial [Deltaproteobacteria bacterium]|nr:hypothetical protein [Deltaproteobacteria bacterium]